MRTAESRAQLQVAAIEVDGWRDDIAAFLGRYDLPRDVREILGTVKFTLGRVEDRLIEVAERKPQPKPDWPVDHAEGE